MLSTRTPATASAQGKGACGACCFAAVGLVRPSYSALPSSRSRRSPRHRTDSRCSTSASTTAASGSPTTRSAPSAGSPSRSAQLDGELAPPSVVHQRRRVAGRPGRRRLRRERRPDLRGQRLRHRVLRRGGGDLARTRRDRARRHQSRCCPTDHSLRATTLSAGGGSLARALRLGQAARRAPAGQLRRRRRHRRHRLGRRRRRAARLSRRAASPSSRQRCRSPRPTRCRSPRSATSRWWPTPPTKTLYLPDSGHTVTLPAADTSSGLRAAAAVGRERRRGRRHRARRCTA